jgi:hypothetical protein
MHIICIVASVISFVFYDICKSNSAWESSWQVFESHCLPPCLSNQIYISKCFPPIIFCLTRSRYNRRMDLMFSCAPTSSSGNWEIKGLFIVGRMVLNINILTCSELPEIVCNYIIIRTMVFKTKQEFT